MLRALLFALSLQTFAFADAPQKVRVLRVIDGDTVVIRTGKGQSDILRFADIDTPEMKAAGGKEAKAYLVKLLATAGKKPMLLTGTRRDSSAKQYSRARPLFTRDKYRRRLGTLTLPDGRNISQLLLTSGHALQWAASVKAR